MQATEIPTTIKRYAPNTTARLLGGTYSMNAPDVHSVPGLPAPRQVTENRLLFRPLNASATAPDEQWRVGSLNPAALASGNQAVLLLLETPEPANIWEEFMRDRRKDNMGGKSVVGCWVPDGAAGRYMVESDPFFIRSWYGYGATARNEKRVLVASVVAVVVGFIIAAVVAQCLLFIIVPVGGFLLKRWLRNQTRDGGLLDSNIAQNELQRWAAQLMESGAFQAEYVRAFGNTSAPIIGNNNEQSLL